LIADEMDGAYVSNEFPNFKIDRSRIYPKFLEFLFKQRLIWKEVERRCTGTTKTSRNRFKEDSFLDFEIFIPPLQDQKRVADKIENLKSRIDQVRELGANQGKSLRQMLRGAYYDLTRDALCLPMSKVAPIVRRPVKVEPDKEYSELGVRSFGRGTFHKPSTSGAALGRKRIYHMQPGDLLFNNVFAWEGAVAVTRAEDAGRVGSHRFITCVPKKELVTAGFLTFHFLTPEGMRDIGKASPGGAGRNRTLGLRKLEQISVPVPKLDRQVWLSELVENVGKIEHLQTEIEYGLDCLLSSAFSAELKKP
jgi:type I restriction enzyme S subunit